MITINMLQAIHETLYLSDPFEACIWALATCVFWGMMHFGEVSVSSQSAFDKTKHLKQQDVLIWMASNMPSLIYHPPRQQSLERSNSFL